MKDVMKTQIKCGCFIKQIIAFLPLYRDYNISDAISTEKNTWKSSATPMFPPGTFPVGMTSFMFPSQHVDTQAVFYWLKR